MADHAIEIAVAVVVVVLLPLVAVALALIYGTLWIAARLTGSRRDVADGLLNRFRAVVSFDPNESPFKWNG